MIEEKCLIVFLSATIIKKLCMFTTLALTIKCLNGRGLELKSTPRLSLHARHSQDI